jgi:sulfonate transport system substrate-binding protein
VASAGCSAPRLFFGRSLRPSEDRIMRTSIWLIAAVLLSPFASHPLSMVHAQEKPSVIRLANPGVGAGNRPAVGGSSWSLIHLRGMFEEEFKPDGIRIEWTFLRGAGPAVNELFANGLADVASYGDLPSTVGRAGGLKTRVLAGSTRFNFYIAVPSESTVRSVNDLRGKRVAVFKGTANQLAANRIFESFGLSERDVRTINMDVATSKAALITKDVDAVIGSSDLIQLRDQGVARLIFSTKGQDPRLAGNGALVASEDFVRKYPSIVKRILKVYVRAAKLLNELPPTDTFKIWSKSGFPYSNFKEDFVGDNLLDRSNPLLDTYFTASFRAAIADEKRFGLLRETFSVESWFDGSFLKQALKEEKLENYWPDRPAAAVSSDGNKVAVQSR